MVTFFDKTVASNSSTKYQKNKFLNQNFFPSDSDLVDCFFSFVLLSYWDNVVKWTEEKVNEKETSREKDSIQRDNILLVLVLWFLMGLVKLPSAEIHFEVGLRKIMNLLEIEDSHTEHLSGMHRFNKLQANM